MVQEGINTHVFIYKTQTDPLSLFQPALAKLQVAENEVEICEELGRDHLVFERLAARSHASDDILLVRSLDNLFPEEKSRPNVLRELLQLPFRTVLLDYPVMLEPEGLAANHLLLRLLLEVAEKPRQSLVELRAEKSKRLGRRRLDFPDNWFDLFAKWQAKEITARDFMKAAGLKRGTFYHMVAEYKQFLDEEQKQQSR